MTDEHSRRSLTHLPVTAFGDALAKQGAELRRTGADRLAEGGREGARKRITRS